MEDYKVRNKRLPPNFGNMVLGIIIGVLLGLIIASAIAVYMLKSPLPFVNKSKAGDRATSAEQAPKQRAEAKSGASTSDQRADKPKLEFYNILPGQESGAGKSSAERTEAAEQVVTVAKLPDSSRDSYIIQAGSFQNPSEADNVKARLAFIGLQASIEPVALPDKGTWYRVRLGPYRNPHEINSIRQQLSQAGVTATMFKVKD
jgi:cell division protein FtsN